MSNFVQPLNPVVTQMAADKLLDFQLQVRDIPNLVRLTFGEPGFAVDERIKQALYAAVEGDRSHYAESQGELALRKAAVAYFNQHANLAYENEDNVIVTLGVTEAINVVFQTLLSAGDGILVPEPAYGPYFMSIDLARGKRVGVDTTADGFKLTPAAVEKALTQADVPVKAILMNYPNNPTGVTYTRDELQALAEVFEKHNIWVISDEIYSTLTYDYEHVSLAELLPRQTVMINGLSKSHAMTGYRIGFILGDKAVIDEMQKVHGAWDFAIPTFIQDAATVALTEVTEAPGEMRDAYRARRDRTVPQLLAAGFDVVNPAGAFYLFAKIPVDLGSDGDAFAMDLATNGGVAVIPGSGFAESAAAYIRISYAADDADLDEGVARLVKRVAELRAEGVRFD
ncbi:MAG TPA: aminotransferase class I/II-fold pyridoxal phosphate-dependent enzyme [Lactobacillaceae bacterium]|jgi:aminotransferase